MTVAFTYKDPVSGARWLAADTYIGTSDCSYICKASKLVQYPWGYFVASGDVYLEQSFLDKFEEVYQDIFYPDGEPAIRAAMNQVEPKNKNDQFEAIMYYQDEVFLLEYPGVVLRPKDNFLAIGEGAQFAYGYHMGYRGYMDFLFAKALIKDCAEYVPSVRCPAQVVEI